MLVHHRFSVRDALKFAFPELKFGELNFANAGIDIQVMYNNI